MTMPEPQALFGRFGMDAGSDDAARARFETFVTHLVKARHQDATTVTSRNHNDWGIDTIVGSLAGGVIQVWQCKFILDWSASSQSQVRESFKSVTGRAKSEGFTLDVWTLVIPLILEPKELQWFQGWAGRQTKETGTTINIWQGVELCDQLLSSEAEHVRREYFPWTVTDLPLAAEAVAELDDDALYNEALFIRQLREAGHTQVSAASGHYFATHALLLDLEARGSSSQLRGLNAMQHEVHGIWEDWFNETAPSADEMGRMRGLYRHVMDDASKMSDPAGIILAAAHKRGTAHHLVERAKAGWVTHWEDVAGQHTAVPAQDATEPSLNEDGTATEVSAPEGMSTASVEG